MTMKNDIQFCLLIFAPIWIFLTVAICTTWTNSFTSVSVKYKKPPSPPHLNILEIPRNTLPWEISQLAITPEISQPELQVLRGK